MNLIIIITIGIILTSVNNAQETCKTPCNQQGECINLRSCSVLMEVLKKPGPRIESDLQILRQSQCGFDGTTPKVCCPLKKTDQIITTSTSRTTTSNYSPSSFETSTSSSSSSPDVTGHRNLRLLDHNLCGHINQPKIVGGNKTGVFDYPWMALLAYRIGSKTDFRCGGTIINKKYIITAAHCVTQLPSNAELIGVRVGEHNLSTERDCDHDDDGLEDVCAEKYQDFTIENINYHPNYSKTKLHNDIGIIRVVGNIDFRPLNVRPICLPIGTASRISQKKLTVTGWGRTEFNTGSIDLLKINIPLVDNEKCSLMYQNKTQIWYKQLCAGGTSGIDSCNGDSGGPLQSPSLYQNNPRFILHGIVSFGTRNCGAGLPGVYTKVSEYIDYILNTIKE